MHYLFEWNMDLGVPFVAPWLSAAFAALTLLVAGAFPAFVYVAWVRAEAPHPKRAAFSTAAILVAWLAFTFVLGARGALSDFQRVPPSLLRVVLPASVAVTALAFSRWGLRLARHLPLPALVGFQGFRVGVEAVLYALHVGGRIPAQMTFAGWNFDVLSGISAFVVAFFALRQTPSRLALAAWNVVSLTFLLVVVVIANLSTPTPFRVFHDEPAPLVLTEPPFVWLPTFLIPTALLGHLLVFRRLRVLATGRGGPRRQVAPAASS